MSNNLERILEQTTELVQYLATTGRPAAIRRRKRRRRAFLKFVKVSALMSITSFLIIVGMISSKLLLGPLGSEGVLAAIVALLTSWALILYFSLRQAPRLPRPTEKVDFPQLAARTEQWLEQQRPALPVAAASLLDRIGVGLEALNPQLRVLNPEQPVAHEVRRLLVDELPELVSGYIRVPRALQRQPLNGGPSPDKQLVEGLTTIEAEIARMHERLATDDLHALATQQRYLEVKYRRDDDLK
jgi:hypothetical protein